jgi:flagellin
MDNLIEMKSLSTQAANDTLGADERGYIADQITELASDINDIADQTIFQDTELLNGTDNTGGVSLTFQVGERSTDTMETTIDAVNVGALFAGLTASASVDLGAGTTAGGAAAGGAGIQASNAAAGDKGGLTFNSATAADFREFINAVDGAIEGMNDRVNEIGMTQSSLSTREVTLSQSISANSSASSRIMDADFAKEQSESVRLQILQQTSTSALAQANMGPQSVLGFLG